MFHLLVKYSGWAKSRDTIPNDRVFEYTEEDIAAEFRPKGKLTIERIARLPALFVTETQGSGPLLARVGTITHASVVGKEVNLEYTFDETISPIPNATLERLAPELDMQAFEFSRGHWAIKNRDLFQVLLRNHVAALPIPKVFKFSSSEIDPKVLAVMMPFNSKFDEVHSTLQAVAKASKMECLRADDIWEEEAIIQDIVSLITKARIVIADCTGRNPNVFYEVGIAHALGRDVILIAQSEEDIPFDLRHLRYIKYLNNSEGRDNLADRLKKRIGTLLKSA